ncbi:phosphate regulon sensor histidine kinase PhoR [Sulfurivermis fontis]|uniref:phosphate regulon sensor histidine kinase PhoR n=1 Tax=Sulfurivermis fontis TaxID=1972068 RepID=UPI000FD7BF27|nr:phosphate regulon sensor histidine kinase PhoR [Sulfurivermis fontis]
MPANPWTPELWRLLWVLLGATLLGAVLGSFWLGWGLGLAVYLGYHIWQLRRLVDWLRSGKTRNIPEAGGLWGEVFHYIYQRQRKHQQRKRQLEEILDRFQQATSALPDATVVIGPKDEILWFNDAAAGLLGLHSAQDKGQPIDNLLRHPDFITYLQQNGRNGEVLRIPSPVDDSLTISIHLINYGRDQRLLVARDISQQQRLDQMRRDFVANVSHELRTPLTVVSGFLETLMDSGDDCAARWQRSLTLMHQQATRMQHLVADLLMLSRLETDRSSPPRELVEVPALLAAIREDAQLLSGDKAHHITLEAEPDLRLYGAERELYSAFSNIVGNAVRYTPAGGEIHLRWWSDSAGAHFSVSDSGIGIPAEHLPRLTERFYRVDTGRSREVGGTGLGLAIVKHVLTRHSARLRIDSRPGKGSTFTIDFPPDRLAGSAT